VIRLDKDDAAYAAKLALPNLPAHFHGSVVNSPYDGSTVAKGLFQILKVCTPPLPLVSLTQLEPTKQTPAPSLTLAAAWGDTVPSPLPHRPRHTPTSNAPRSGSRLTCEHRPHHPQPQYEGEGLSIGNAHSSAVRVVVVCVCVSNGISLQTLDSPLLDVVVGGSDRQTAAAAAAVVETQGEGRTPEARGERRTVPSWHPHHRLSPRSTRQARREAVARRSSSQRVVSRHR